MYRLMFALSFLLLFFFCIPASAIEIKSYDDLYKTLPGGVDSTDFNKGVISKAQKLVADRQLLRRRRKIKFMKPIDLADINEKYISVAFAVQIKPRKKSVFTLLFEKAGPNRIAFPNTMYLSWLGDKDIQLFKNMTIDALSKNYQDMGVEDCRVEFVRTKVEKILATKSSVGHKHTTQDISGVIHEKRIDSSITRDSELKAKVDLYVKNLEDRIVRLEKKINELNATLKGVNRNGSTLTFNNMNVQITNGRGATGKINGRGNLIVGYNESRGADSRKGSHNVVVGGKNNFSSYGCIVSGYNNTGSGKYSFVGGGHNNAASGEYSSILGGSKNNAKGSYSSINGQTGRTKVGSGQNKHFKK